MFNMSFRQMTFVPYVDTKSLTGNELASPIVLSYSTHMYIVDYFLPLCISLQLLSKFIMNIVLTKFNNCFTY